MRSACGGLRVKNSLYPILYAAVLGLVSASLLTGAESLTGPYKDANMRAERMRNILKVLEVPFPAKAPAQELVKIFETNVREEKSRSLTVYTYAPPKTGGITEAAAVGFQGPGLWGPIKGFLALEPNMKVIRGITFYQQEETPGLGGEISSSWFTAQFKGKYIVAADGQAGIRIKQPGASSKQNEVDAITGATMTCDKLEEILNALIEKIANQQVKNGQ